MPSRFGARRFVALLALGLGPCAVLSAQSATPSDSILDPYDNVWRVTVRLADGTVRFQGLWTDHLERRELVGRHLWLRVQGMTYANGLTSSFVNAFETGSMRPLYSEVRGPKGNWQRRDFWPDSIIVRRREPLATSDSTARLSIGAPVYDFYGGMYGVLLAALPLRAGMTGKLPAIAEFTDTLATAEYRVLRRERTPAGAFGARDAWVVATEQDGAKMTFWLSDRAPYVIRLVILNPNGIRSEFEML